MFEWPENVECPGFDEEEVWFVPESGPARNERRALCKSDERLFFRRVNNPDRKSANAAGSLGAEIPFDQYLMDAWVPARLSASGCFGLLLPLFIP